MTAVRSGIGLALATASILLVASPAFAWTCVAKNVRGATYVGVGILKQNAIDRAIAKCHLRTVINASCVIIDCDP